MDRIMSFCWLFFVASTSRSWPFLVPQKLQTNNNKALHAVVTWKIFDIRRSICSKHLRGTTKCDVPIIRSQSAKKNTCGYPPWNYHKPWKSIVGWWNSFWEGLLSGAMLVRIPECNGECSFCTDSWNFLVVLSVFACASALWVSPANTRVFKCSSREPFRPHKLGAKHQTSKPSRFNHVNPSPPPSKKRWTVVVDWNMLAWWGGRLKSWSVSFCFPFLQVFLHSTYPLLLSWICWVHEAPNYRRIAPAALQSKTSKFAVDFKRLGCTTKLGGGGYLKKKPIVTQIIRSEKKKKKRGIFVKHEGW